jgi:hypothetical protein
MADVRLIPLSDRKILGELLNMRSPSDAMAAYYALEHPPERTKLYGYYQADGQPSGFLVEAQTGLDLFRPLLVPFAGMAIAVGSLIRAALEAGRPALIHLPLEQRTWAEAVAEVTQTQLVDLLRLNPGDFNPVINVLVVESQSPDGRPRFEIRSQSGITAAAGVNWIGDHFADVYLEADEQARNRGYARSVLSAISGLLLQQRRIALYQVDESTPAERAEAASIGFRPTGTRSIIAQAAPRPPGLSKES